MGASNSKISSDTIGKYDCILRNGANDDHIQLKAIKSNIQFGNRYVYFEIPKDKLKNLSNMYLQFKEFTGNIDYEDFGEIKLQGINTFYKKNIIEKEQYYDYMNTTQKGQFIVRLSVRNKNKGYIVYIYKVEF